MVLIARVSFLFIIAISGLLIVIGVNLLLCLINKLYYRYVCIRKNTAYVGFGHLLEVLETYPPWIRRVAVLSTISPLLIFVGNEFFAFITVF